MSTDASIEEMTSYYEPSPELLVAYEAEVTAERAAYERYKQACAEWRTKWPNACKSCGGWGGHSCNYDPSPAGVSLASGSMRDFDPCEAPGCISEGFCARCGNPTLSELPGVLKEGQGPCKQCGWDYDDGEPIW